MMNPTNRNVLLMLLLLLSAILLPALADTGMLSLDEDDGTFDDDISFMDPIHWMRIPDYRTSAGLMLGMSIFARVIVYRGGRSSRARFNDRTIADDNLFRGIFFSLKAALSGAVFNFLLSVFLSFPTAYTRRYP